MKNIKKLICLILTLSFLFTTFTAFSRESLPPFEYMDDIFRFDVGDFIADSEDVGEEYDADVERMKLLETLGIWDDAEKSKGALITMTEFSIIMSNLRLGAENALKGVYAHEDNKNEAKATYKNAFEHLLESLGYYYRCAQYGNTAESLLIVAADIGLISENPENINAYITRAELAKLISRALTIDICSMEYTSTGGYKYTVADGKNLLNTIHGIYEVGGFVNAVPGFAIYGGVSCREGYIQIDRMNVNTSGLDLTEFLGSRVTAYATFDEDINEYNIIYMDYAEDNQQLEIDFSDIIDMDSRSITYVNDENAELEIAIDSLSYISENGDKLNDISEMSDYKTNEGKIVFAATERKGDIDTAIIYKYNYFVVSYVDTNNFRVGLQFNQEYDGKKFLQLNDKAVNVVYIDGVKTDITKLAAGTAIRYLTCEATDYTEIVGQTKKLDGEVESIYDDTVTILNNEYRQSKDLLNIIERGKTDPTIHAQERVKDIELGLTTTFYVFDNLLVGYTSTQTYKWGYLKSITKSRTSIDPDLTLRILTESSEWIDLKVTDKLELDGQPNVSKEEFLTRVNNNMDIINNVVRFKSGKAGELAALDTIEISQYESDSYEDVELVYNYNYVLNWTYEWLQMECPYIMSASTVIFIVPAGEEDEKKMKAVNVSAMPIGGGTESSNYLPMKFYTPNRIHQIGAAICTKEIGKSSVGGSNNPTAFVESMRYALIDADNMEFGYKITGKELVAQAESATGGYLQDFSVYVSEELIDKNEVLPGETGYDEDNKIEVGDVITFYTSNGRANSWDMLLKDGKVPPIAAETEDPDDVDFIKDGTELASGQGIVKYVDTTSQYMLIEYDGVDYPILSRCKVMIDVDNNKIEHISISDYQPGDRVYTSIYCGRGTFVIKNK